MKRLLKSAAKVLRDLVVPSFIGLGIFMVVNNHVELGIYFSVLGIFVELLVIEGQLK